MVYYAGQRWHRGLYDVRSGDDEEVWSCSLARTTNNENGSLLEVIPGNKRVW
jgi:hypothetical protein